MGKLKIIICCFIIFFSFSMIVQAEECRKDDIKIEDVNLIETQGNIEETITPNNDDNKVNLGLKMNVIGDSSTYKVVIKNTSDKDYVFDKNEIQKDYINYDISYEDNSNIVKAGEEKTIYLRLNYNSKPQESNLSNGVFSNNSRVSFNLTKESNIIDNLINPNTGSSIFYIVIISLILVLFIMFKKKYRTSSLIVLLLLLITPKIVNAVCTCSLDINLDMVIDAKEAIFLPGREVNGKIKILAGNDISNLTYPSNYSDSFIKAIKRSEIEPNDSNKEEKNIVSTLESKYSIYMWYDNRTIYWWSEDDTPSLNEDATSMFSSLNNLSDISGVVNFDLTHTNTLYATFDHDNLINLESLSLWNTSNVVDMSFVFENNFNMKDMLGIKNWNVENVKNMSGLFNRCFDLETIDLSTWKTTSLENISSMFSMPGSGNTALNGKLKRIILSEKFDTSKVNTMSNAFSYIPNLEDYSFLTYLDTSNVVIMDGIFLYNKGLNNLSYIKNWDVSKVTTLKRAFCYCTVLENLDGLENWDVSSVVDFSYAFSDDRKLNNVDAVNDWNILENANFNKMFSSVGIHPNFSSVVGTWSNGTFTPIE